MTNRASAHTPAPERNDKQAIQQVGADWIAAMNAKDIAKLMTMITEDIVFLPPGFPSSAFESGSWTRTNVRSPKLRSKLRTTLPTRRVYCSC
jgi:hypothetical protein